MHIVNWLILDVLLNIGVWFLAIMVAIAALSANIYRLTWIGEFFNVVVWSVLTFVVVIIAFVLFVVASNLIVNDWGRGPSKVDVLPIAAINEAQFERIDTAMLQLVNQGYVHDLFFTDPAGMHSHRYSTRWIPQTQFSHDMSLLTISVTHYNNEERAVSWLLSSARYNSQHEYFQNINNTDVLSIYPWMPVSAGGWYVPSDLRQLRTEIRIGNVVIVLREERHWANMRNDYSSQFIAVFVEALQQIES